MIPHHHNNTHHINN
jgi:hypothetical protein